MCVECLAILKHFDGFASDDDEIDPDDIEELKLSDELVKEIFSVADINNNGKLTKEGKSLKTMWQFIFFCPKRVTRKPKA